MDQRDLGILQVTPKWCCGTRAPSCIAGLPAVQRDAETAEKRCHPASNGGKLLLHPQPWLRWAERCPPGFLSEACWMGMLSRGRGRGG